MVPVDEPEANATETFRFELWEVDDETCPVTVNVVPVGATAGKQDPLGLFTDVTVPAIAFPFWVKLTVRLVLDDGAAGAKTTLQLPEITGVWFADIDDE